MSKTEECFKITDSQWEVLEVLWEAAGPKTVTEIRSILAEKGIHWKNNTIHTFLARLAEHGVVANTEKTPKQFYPLVQRADCLREENRSFLRKVYKGSVKAMISTLIKDGGLSPEELAEIRKILEEDQK